MVVIWVWLGSKSSFFGHITFRILYLSINVKLTAGYSDLRLKEEVGAGDIKIETIHIR